MKQPYIIHMHPAPHQKKKSQINEDQKEARRSTLIPMSTIDTGIYHWKETEATEMEVGITSKQPVAGMTQNKMKSSERTHQMKQIETIPLKPSIFS